MATRSHHPYSFSKPVEPAVEARRRELALADERRRHAWDSEAPGTARDSELERKESNAPFLVAGAVSAAVLGGLLLALGFSLGDPRLSPTVEVETARQNPALSEMLNAQALDRAHAAARGLAVSPPQAPVAPEATESAGADASDAASSGAVQPLESRSSEPEPQSGMSQPEESLMTPEPQEPLMTPAPSVITPSAIELDSDNPYTPEHERPADVNDATPATPSGTSASDNPY